jgi:hypothetical protein
MEARCRRRISSEIDCPFSAPQQENKWNSSLGRIATPAVSEHFEEEIMDKRIAGLGGAGA